jgi:hypothetical protein
MPIAVALRMSSGKSDGKKVKILGEEGGRKL